MRDVLEDLIGWWQAGETVGMGTVVATWRSAPRPAGAAMLVGPDGTAVGSGSGGCVEGAGYEEGKDAVETAEPRLQRYGGGGDDALAVGVARRGIPAVVRGAGARGAVPPARGGGRAAAPALGRERRRRLRRGAALGGHPGRFRGAGVAGVVPRARGGRRVGRAARAGGRRHGGQGARRPAGPAAGALGRPLLGIAGPRAAGRRRRRRRPRDARRGPDRAPARRARR